MTLDAVVAALALLMPRAGAGVGSNGLPARRLSRRSRMTTQSKLNRQRRNPKTDRFSAPSDERGRVVTVYRDETNCLMERVHRLLRHMPH